MADFAPVIVSDKKRLFNSASDGLLVKWGNLSDVDMTTAAPVAGDKACFNGVNWVPVNLAAQPTVIGAGQEGLIGLTEQGSNDTNRIFLWLLAVEDDTDAGITSVTIGGVPMVLLGEFTVTTTFENRISACFITEAQIQALTWPADIVVTWSTPTPNDFVHVGYFIDNVDQALPAESVQDDQQTGGTTTTTPCVSTVDKSLYVWGMCAGTSESVTFSPVPTVSNVQTSGATMTGAVAILEVSDQIQRDLVASTDTTTNRSIHASFAIRGSLI